MKDVIRWPRPGFPVSRLQKKWALEYGMPSTHAMVSVAIPFSVLIYTYDRYRVALNNREVLIILRMFCSFQIHIFISSGSGICFDMVCSDLCEQNLLGNA